ncbi:MAG TPA: hypothetical protein ENI73_01215 [Spirochaetes bacterium]|nr:hypothetical protein [Spirochaetota bacterium]
MYAQPHVWYASYGSNLSQDRFLFYINGGKPEGATRINIGCRDKSLPKDNRPINIPYLLYFTKQAYPWAYKGVAFIGLNKDHSNSTLGRMYLVSEQQFIDVVSQENGDIEMPIIDLKALQKVGSKVIFKDSWYGNIIYIGELEGYPIFTFTSSASMDAESFVAPSYEYLKVIITGLQETYFYTNKEIADYLLTKPGIMNNFTQEELIKTAFS